MKTLLPLLENAPVTCCRKFAKWLYTLSFFVATLVCYQPIFGQASQTFNANGTFTVPAGVTSVTVECWGGGGKGGARTTNGVGGGGGGGAYSRSVIPVGPGTNHTVTVGAGATTTAAGGTSWFSTSATISAPGGQSVTNDNATGAAGGGLGIGTVRFTGGTGRTGVALTYGGGGGSSAGTAANGTNAANQNGAVAPAGGGNGGNGRATTQGPGVAGSVPGGGGGGSFRNGTSQVGGNGANGRVVVSWVPAYASQFISMSTGSSTWCPGETRTVSVTVRNAGQATWTNAGPDINIGVKWNGDPDYLVRTDANDLAPGATQTYFLTVTAPATPATNNLTFDVVYEGICWFGNNGGTCGPGNTVYTSPLITIGTPPAITSHPSVTNRTYCVGAATNALSVAATGSGVSYQWYSNTVASNSGGTLIPGATGNSYTPPSSTPGTRYYYAVASGCTPAATSNVSGSYTINDHATLSLTSAPSSQSQALCIGSAVEDITLLVGGAGTGATVSSGTLPPGLITNFSGGVFTISGTPTVPGSYSFSVQTTGSLCTNPVLNFSITIQDQPTLVLNSAIGTDAQSVCINTPITDIVYLVGGGGGVNTTGLPAGISTSLAAGIFTISGTPTTEGIFNFEVVTTGAVCTNITLTGTIQVGGDGTFVLSSDPSTTNQLVCEGSAITDIAYTIGGTANGADITAGALPAGVTGVFSGGVYTISGTPASSGVYNYTISTTGSACVNPSLSGTITVNTPGTLVQASAAGTENQVLCINTIATDLVYTTGGGATGASITSGALPAGMAGTFNAGVFTISGTPTVAGVFNFTVSTTGACTNESLAGTITVIEDAFITLNSSTASPVNCINTALTTITFAVGGSATGASITAGTLPAGLSAAFNGGLFTIEGIPTESGVFAYTVTTSGPCANASASGTITINADGTISLSSPGTENQTLCINNAIGAITYNIGGGATGASISSGSLPAGVTGTYSGGVFTISGTPTASGSFNFTVRADGPCVQPTLSGSILVQANSTITLSSGAGTNNRTLCINTSMPAITYSIGAGGTGASLTSGSFPAGISGTFSGGVYTISGTPTVSGSFPYTITTSGPCVNASASGTILVNADGTIALTSPGADNQTLCINTAITPVTYAIGGGATGASISAGALPAGVTGTYSGGVFTISGTPAAAGTFNFTVRANGPCVQPTLSGTIIVQANSTITLTSGVGTNNRTVCINTAMPGITYSVAGGGTGAVLTAGSFPAGISGVYNAGVYTISGTPTVSGSFPYTITTTGPCVNVSASGTILVNANGTISLTSPGADNQTVCINNSITPITYSIGGGATGASISAGGLPAGVTGTFSGGVFTISGTPIVSGTFNFTVRANGPCVQPTLSGVINVDANSTITLSSGAGSNNRTVCINTAMPAITWLIAGGGNGATVTGLPSGVTGSYNSTTKVFTVSGTPTVSGSFPYTVTTTGPCVNNSSTGTITVNADATLVLTSAPGSNIQTVCVSQQSIFSITYLIGGGGTGATVTGLPAGITGSYNAGTKVFTISGTPTASGTFNYTVNSTGPCLKPSLTGTITVNPRPVANAITGANNVCINETIALSSNATGTAPLTYTWASSNPAVATVTNGGVVTGLTAGTTNISYTVTNGFGCTQTSAAFAVTVKAIPVGTLTANETSGSASNDNIICAGSNVTFTATPGFVVYHFKVNGSTVQNGTANVYNTTTLTNGAVVTVEVSNSNSCTVTFNSITVTVNPVPAGTLTAAENSGVPNNNQICAGEAVTFTATAGYGNYVFLVNGSGVQSGASNTFTTTTLTGTATVSVEVTNGSNCKATWGPQVITVSNIPGGTLTATENSGSVSNNNEICAGDAVTFTATAGLSNYNFIVNGISQQNGASNTFTTSALTNPSIVTAQVTNAGGCQANLGPVVISVNDLPSGTLAGSENSGTPDDMVICAGDPATFTATSGYTNYSFRLNGSPVQNGASPVFTSGTLNNGDVISVEVTGDGGCKVLFNTVSITVAPLPSATLVATENSGTPNNNTVCTGDNITFTAPAGHLNYQFLVNGLPTQNGVSNIFSSTALMNGDVVSAVITGTNGCNATSQAIPVTVADLPAGSLVISETSGNAANDAVICAGDAATFTATAGFSSYTFYVDGVPVQSGASNIYTSSSIVNGESVTVEAFNAAGCTQVYNNIVVTVNPLPAGSLSAAENSGTPNDLVICPNAGVTFNATPGFMNYDFRINGVSAQSSASSTFISTSISTSSSVTVIMTNANGCTVTSNSVGITVSPLPVGTLSATENSGNAPNDNAICSGATVVFTATSGYAGYTFQVNGSTVQSGASEIYSSSSLVDGDVVSVIVVHANGCNQQFAAITISVYDYPVVPAITGAAGVCVGSTTTLSNAIGGGTWLSNNTAIATVNPSTGLVTGVAVGNVTISYTVTNANGCATTVTKALEVYSLPVPTLSGPNPFCPETVSEYITEAGQFNYVWTVTGGTILSGGTSTDNSIMVDWNLPGVKSIFVNYTNANGCTGATSTTVTGSTGTVPVISGPFQVCNNSIGNTYTTQSGFLSYIWSVNGGTITAGGTPSDDFVTVTWNTPGTGTVSVNFSDINGCTAAEATNYSVLVRPIPTALITGNTQVCRNASSPSVTFTGSGGVAPYTFAYQLNAGAVQTITTTSGNSVSLPVPTSSTGSFEYTLVSISGANGCGQPQTGAATFIVNELPSAAIAGDNTICQGGSSNITFTGSNGTAPYTFTYTINSGSPQTITTVSGNSIDLPVVTSVPGTFTFALTQVSDANGCGQPASGSAVVIINAAPTASVSGNTSVCINSASPVITFTGAGGTAPYTFSYNINGGGTQTIVSTGNTATLLVPTTIAGTFVYSLESVQDASSTVCGQAQSGNATVVVSPATAGGTLNGSTSVCTSINSTVLTLTGFTGNINGWESSTNGGATWSPIANTLATLTVSGLTQTTQYRVLVQSGSCAQTTSTVATITVLNVSGGGTVGTSTTVCAGSNSGTLTLSGHTGSVIRWESSTNGGATWSPISNTTTTQAYSNLSQTTQYRAVVANGPCSQAPSTPATISVNARPTGVLSGSGNMCQGAGRTLTITVTGSGTISGTLSGGIPFSGTAPTITVNVNPAGTTAYTIASLSDANCTALPANLSGTATVTVLSLPAVFSVTPANTTMCAGTVTALTATGSVPTNGTASAASGSVNLGIPDASLFGTSGVRTHSLNISGVPAGAVITSVAVNFNIAHTAAGDLQINLRAPNGNVLNLVNNRGGTGNNFTNTTVSSAGVIPINGAAAPFTNTYSPDAGIGVGPGGNVSNVAGFNGLYSVPNGNWTFVAEDNVWALFGNTGTLNSWTITINYTVPSVLPSTWSPVSGLYSDPGATIAYAGQALTTVYASPATGSHVYTATFANAQGCQRTATANVTVNPAPVVTIVADYCAIPGQIQLTANSTPAGTGYLWNTGATTQTIGVDEAGTYDVTVTTALGCPGRGTTYIAQELVVNGDFEAGNTGFFTEYTLATGFNLYPEGEYAVGTDAHLYHDQFYGKDHTTAAQTGNFMMINGSSTLIGSPGRLRTIWQQTVNVLPNTDYYFSAWAMNLNPGSPARLQFEVNGVPVGTIADLNAAPKPTSQGQVNINNWVRFYSNPTWNSGVTTTAVIRIINLNTDPGGNDFGLDDISFGTLRPFINLVSAPGTDAQTLCVNTPITNVIYSVAGGASGPNVTGLPPGVTSVYNGTTVTISGTPTAGGTFGYSITTTGTCNPITATGTLTVQQQSVTLSSGSGAQNACMGSPITQVQYALAGTATGATVSGLPAGVTATVSGGFVTINGTPTVSGLFTYTINTTGTCQPASTTGSINVQGQSIALFSGNTAQVRCVNTAISNIVYTTGGTATGASVSGLPPGVSGNFSGGILIISGTPTLAGTYNYTVTTSGTCNPATISGSIQVNPAATIVLSSAAGSNTQTSCVNNPVTPITYTIGGGGTGATVTGLPTGVTGTYSGGTFTISGSPTVNGTFNYTVSTTGTCAQASATGSITVQGASVTLSSGTASQALCNNTAITNIVFSIGGTATGATASNLPPGVTGTYSAGSFTISGTPTSAGTFNYTVTSTGSCAGATAGGTITVGTGSIGGSLPDVYVCNNGGGVLTLTGHSGGIIRWESSTDGGTTWTNIANVTATHTFSAITVPTQFRVRVQVGSCPATYSSTGTVGVRNMWTGSVSSDWFTAANWSNNTLPSMACADVIVPVVLPPNVYPILTAGTGSVNNIIIRAGASLTVSNGTLEIAGNINNSGTFNVANGTINMNGSSPQAIPVNAFTSNNLQHLLVGNSHTSGLTIQGPLNIYGSLKYTATGTRLVTGNMLTLKSTATGTAWVGNMTGKVIVGDVTVERYIHTGTGAGMHPKSWQLLAVPTFGPQTVNAAWQEGSAFPNQNNVPGYGTMITSNLPGATGLGFDAFTAPGGTMKTYNANGFVWDGVTSTNSLPIANSRGYMILVRGDRSVITSTAAPVPTVLRTTGKLFTTGADAPPPVNVAAGKFESVGNPYASAINLTSTGINRVNLADVYYVWDPQLTSLGANSNYGLGAYQTLTRGMDGNYHVTPGGGSYGAGGSIRNTIESGQAFMILSNGSEGSIAFTEAAKVEGSNLVSRVSSLPESEIRTNLYVMNNGYQVLLDGVANQFNEVYNSAVDVSDALKIGNFSETFSIARSGKLLAVEQRKPVTASDTIFFNLGQVRQQQYKLEFNPANMVTPGLSAWLEDAHLGTSIPVSLEQPTTISFNVQGNAPGSYAPNRFRLVFRQLMAPLPVTIVTVAATRNADATVNIRWEVENETSIEKYEVERSEGGRVFSGILTEGPRANNGGQAAYVRTDISPLKYGNFYRIKAISRNGLVQYSPIVKVDDLLVPGTITVYPNPVINKTLNLKCSAMDEGKYSLNIFSANGKPVYRNSLEMTGTTATRSFPLGNLAAGTYYLQLTNSEGKKWQVTFIVQ